MDPIKAVLTFIAALFFAMSPFLQGGFTGYDLTAFPVPLTAPPVQPAGYAFAIWGPIFLGLLVMGGFGLFVRAQDGAWEDTRMPLILSMGPGAVWIGIAKGSPLAATVLIFWMLGTALFALFRVPHRDRWLLQGPVAVYAGWLTAASWVSLALIGAGYGIGFGPVGWAIVSLIGAAGTGLAVLHRLRRAPEYGVALIWALVGIVVANAKSNLMVAGLAAVLALAMALKAWQVRQVTPD